MTNLSKARIAKWIISFAVPEVANFLFLLHNLFVTRNISFCGWSCITAMVYIWFYAIILAVCISADDAHNKIIMPEEED